MWEHTNVFLNNVFFFLFDINQGHHIGWFFIFFLYFLGATGALGFNLF